MNIIITGASSGIGYQTAIRFALAGDNKVIAVGRRAENLQKLAAEKTQGSIIPVIADLTNYNYTGLDTALDQHGITHVDVLIHNAGQLINKPFENLEPAEWEILYKANLIAPAILTRHLLPKLGGSDKFSHIVMIGSIGGVNGTLKFPGLSAYSSSKGALATLAECLAEEFKGKNISVNCLALGSVQTEMLTKAFPGYVSGMTAEVMAEYIREFSERGWRHFNGKILQVSTTNP
jgi:NAD(P)-dependent dehydrogenase (short-subunit alcohol dehydrogenase family)